MYPVMRQEFFWKFSLSDLPFPLVFVKPTANELKKKATASEDILLDQAIDLNEAAIDSAPFQLVLGSSLHKVHTLFSLLALSHAYVTDRGRLVGVIALKEVLFCMFIFITILQNLE
ncbi:unnamed protein product [Onchocerca flexuosa]|uniref:CBS domain-containing protein n=1 Tax=Onchocerca flexuosa TaxID=387005 RepID=A0A183H025_9BILA|nr:unnamed protein product [Onchocerca flexuosa]